MAGVKSCNDTLVFIENGSYTVIVEESDMGLQLDTKNEFWKKVSLESMKCAWGKKDEIWDKITEEEKF